MGEGQASPGQVRPNPACCCCWLLLMVLLLLLAVLVLQLQVIWMVLNGS